ncbi:MAG: DegT/DnrJ/EryC1/StrS family aminotransferase, partial [Ardenticatenales bacterium]
MIDLFRPLQTPDAARAAYEALTPSADGRLMIGQGPVVDRFEAQFRRYVNAPRDVVTTNSCTAALDLALHLIGVGAGDEVITTPQTCTATNGVIVNRGAVPVWADVDPLTGLIDPESVVHLVTPRTRAVMAVDWAGRPCDYAGLRSAAPGLPIIQDAAHRGPTPIGEDHGDYVAWSFQAIKFLSTPDGGALMCPDDHTTERARLLRWFGLDRRSSADFRCAQDIVEAGFKHHMNDVTAAIALANLPAARTAVRAQRARAERYCRVFRSLGGGIDVPSFYEDCDYWLFTILVEDRDGFEAHLRERGVATSQVHARNDGHTAFRIANGRATARVET